MAGKIESGVFNIFIPGRAEYRRLIESLRVMLATITFLLMINVKPPASSPLFVAALGFGFYAAALLWMAVNGTINVQKRIFYWLDALWLLVVVALAGEARAVYFLLLVFPVFFAAWRSGYREGIAIAIFSGLASLAIFAFQRPDLPLEQLGALPLSLLVVGPFFVMLERGEAMAQKGQVLAATVINGIGPRLDVANIISDLLAQLGKHMRASVALLAVRTFEGKCRVYCWDPVFGFSELSENAAQTLADQALSLPAETAIAWLADRHWWSFNRQLEIGPQGAPVASPFPRRDLLVTLSGIVGQPRLLTVPLNSTAIGETRLLLAGEAIDINLQSLAMLQFIVDQIAPSIENACLRERLATEAAATERAKIGRDLHDSAIQPYIGLKYALEAVQRRAGPGNVVTPDLARLTEMMSAELASLREVVSGLRGVQGKGGKLLTSALQREAVRFGQLFGIEVQLAVDGDIPVSRNMAGELFHIVAEGLSNIRRHTQSRRANIALKISGGQLVLSICNDNVPGIPVVQNFMPRSLAERAAELGGFIEVQCCGSATTVIVQVPMPAGELKGDIK